MPSLGNTFTFDFSNTPINFSQMSGMLDNNFGLNFNFMMPTPDYSQLLQNAIKLNEQYMAIMSEKNKTIMQTIQVNSATQTKADGKPIASQAPIDDSKNISYDAKELKAKWAAKKPHLTDKFYEKVVKIAKKLNCNPNSLMALMNAESGISPTAKNSESSATGLIQFIESTAKDLGTTTEKLGKMSAEKQLKYVEKYLTKNKKEAGISDTQFVDAGTLYALVFLPGRANREFVTDQSERYYSAGENESLDLNKDGYIAKTELAQRLQNFMA